MRPSWPPPRMPIVAPGASISARGITTTGRSATPSVWCCRQRSSRLGDRRVAEREDRGGAQRRVDRAGLADRKGRDRHAARHLHDRQQAVDALERAAFDRHAEHRQRRQRRRHAGQMRGAAGAGDDHLEPARAGAARIVVKPLGRAMRRDDARLMGDAELVEGLAACCIVSQSDWLPMMMPTARPASLIGLLPERLRGPRYIIGGQRAQGFRQTVGIAAAAPGQAMMSGSNSLSIFEI